MGKESLILYYILKLQTVHESLKNSKTMLSGLRLFLGFCLQARTISMPSVDMIGI